MDSTAIIAPYIPFLLPAGVLAAALAAHWAAIIPSVSIWLLAGGVAAGQVARVPLPGQSGGLLASDIAAVALLWSALWVLGTSSVLESRRTGKAAAITPLQAALLFLPFLFVSLWLLIIQSRPLAGTEFMVAASYWARLCVTMLLLPALLVMARRVPGFYTSIKQSFFALVAVLVIFGYAQLAVLPDLGVLSGGWDPHQGRMASTWLDPNFFGAFLAMSVPYVALSRFRRQYLRWLLLVALLVALALTESRSALLAFMATMMLLSPALLWKWRRAFTPRVAIAGAAIAVIGIAWLFAAGMLLGDRMGGLWRHDPTVSLRADSLRAIWSLLAENRALLGVGYNGYQFAALEAGLIDTLAIHSRAGADNSLLTLWVTTGVIGILLFFLPWAAWIIFFAKKWIADNSRLALAAIASFCILMIHSQFVNSFLYGHLLIVLIMGFALAYAEER